MSRKLASSFFVSFILVAGGCWDFGVAVDTEADPGLSFGSATDAGSLDGGPGSDCVEGPTEPSDEGPQLRYSTLKVNNPMLTISLGDAVTWTNTDSMRHSVVAGAPGAEIPPERGGFNSGEFGNGGKFAFRFCDPRTVIYFCSTHPAQMNGYRIIVE